VGHNKQIRNKWKAAYYFSYKILKFTNKFLSYHSNGYTSYIPKNIRIGYKNQPLFIVLGDWLEQKNRQNQIGK